MEEFDKHQFITIYLPAPTMDDMLYDKKKTEWYFLEDDEKGSISPRNELEALGMLYSTLSGLLVSVDCDQEFTSLTALQNIVTERLKLFASTEPAQGRDIENCEEVEAELIAWAVEQGIQSKLKIIEFEGFGRGGAAATDINIGDLVLEIPVESLIYECTALNSSMMTGCSVVTVGRFEW